MTDGTHKDELNDAVASPVDVLVRLRDIISIFEEYSDLRGLNYIPIKKPTHGSCCTCQDCGYDNDQCVCFHNEILVLIKNLETFKAPIILNNQDIGMGLVLIKCKCCGEEYKAHNLSNALQYSLVPNYGCHKCRGEIPVVQDLAI